MAVFCSKPPQPFQSTSRTSIICQDIALASTLRSVPSTHHLDRKVPLWQKEIWENKLKRRHEFAAKKWSNICYCRHITNCESGLLGLQDCFACRSRIEANRCLYDEIESLRMHSDLSSDASLPSDFDLGEQPFASFSEEVSLSEDCELSSSKLQASAFGDCDGESVLGNARSFANNGPYESLEGRQPLSSEALETEKFVKLIILPVVNVASAEAPPLEKEASDSLNAQKKSQTSSEPQIYAEERGDGVRANASLCSKYKAIPEAFPPLAHPSRTAFPQVSKKPLPKLEANLGCEKSLTEDSRGELLPRGQDLERPITKTESLAKYGSQHFQLSASVPPSSRQEPSPEASVHRMLAREEVNYNVFSPKTCEARKHALVQSLEEQQSIEMVGIAPEEGGEFRSFPTENKLLEHQEEQMKHSLVDRLKTELQKRKIFLRPLKSKKKVASTSSKKNDILENQENIVMPSLVDVRNKKMDCSCEGYYSRVSQGSSKGSVQSPLSPEDNPWKFDSQYYRGIAPEQEPGTPIAARSLKSENFTEKMERFVSQLVES